MKDNAPMARGRLISWTTNDLLLVSTIALVAGLLTALNSTIYFGVFAGGGAYAAQALIGVSMFCALFAPYLIWRPGAAPFSQLIVGLVQIPLSASSWIAALFLLPYGMLSEVAFALTRYRAYSLFFIAFAGGLIMLLIGYAPMVFIIWPFQLKRCSLPCVRLQVRLAAGLPNYWPIRLYARACFQERSDCNLRRFSRVTWM